MIADGATVVAADLVTPEIDGAFGESFDLTDEGSVANFVERVVSRHGRIDIVHNNAALQSEARRQRDLDVINLDTETWDAAMAVNARGPVLLCTHAIRLEEHTSELLSLMRITYTLFFSKIKNTYHTHNPS